MWEDLFLKKYFVKNGGEKKPSKQVKIELPKLSQSVEYKIKLKSTHKELFSILKVGAIIKNNSQPVLSSAFCSDYLLKTLPPEALGL